VAISRRLRYEVLRRDNHTCRYCGGTAPDVALTVDHVMPVSLGGTDEPANLVTACIDCNAGKASTNPGAPLVADVAEDAVRWTRAMRYVLEAQNAKLAERMAYLDDVDHAWTNWRVGKGLDGKGKELPRPQDWQHGVETFFANDVSLDEWRYAIGRAMGNDRVQPESVWRYVCGILWNRIRERVDAARTVAAAMEAEDL